MDKIRKIAEYKIVDFNTNKIESAINIVIGTAKSLGIKIIGDIPIIPGNFDQKHTKKTKINKQFRLLKVKKTKLEKDSDKDSEDKKNIDEEKK